MDIVDAIVTSNKCYQAAIPLVPRGLMLHSIGTPQPSAAVLARYFDQYQPGGQSVCVHAFAQADGTVYQTLPWEMRGWHCGGSANNTHIGVEMTEPGAGTAYAEAAAQITGTYRTAVALFARLCGVTGWTRWPTASSSATRRDTGAAWPATTQTRNICGGSTAWASPWTDFAPTSPRRWPVRRRRKQT